MACVYNKGERSNVMECVYTNFSINKQASENDIATDIPEVQENNAPAVETSEISEKETVTEADLEQEYKQLSLFDNDNDGELPF